MNTLFFVGLAVAVTIVLFMVGKFNDLHSAARADWGSRIDRLLAKCPERVNEPDKRGQTPLMHASKFGAMESMAALLRGGADLSAQCHEGGTALHWAAWLGRKEAVLLLLDRGASPDVVDKEGATPIVFARHRGHDEIVAILEGNTNGRHTS